MKQFDSLYELKRSVYLWILPFIVLALITFDLFPSAKELPNYLMVTLLLVPWFVLSWLMIYFHRFITVVEWANLGLISVLHIAEMYDTIFNYMAVGRPGAIGMSIVWTPMLFIFIFISLKAKPALYLSLSVFIVTLFFGILNVTDIHTNYQAPLIEFYISDIVYIVVLYFAQHLFKLYARLGAAKRNAFQDFLTRIANRHQIDLWLEEKVERATQKNQMFSIIFFDVDYFKVINDRFGHKTGDTFLIEFVELIKISLSEGELFGRWGGEEFIIIKEGSKAQAEALAKFLRVKISNHVFELVGTQTASFGVTEYQLGDTVDTLLTRVDTGLYNAKNIGRDQVSLI